MNRRHFLALAGPLIPEGSMTWESYWEFRVAWFFVGLAASAVAVLFMVIVTFSRAPECPKCGRKLVKRDGSPLRTCLFHDEVSF